MYHLTIGLKPSLFIISLPPHIRRHYFDYRHFPPGFAVTYKQHLLTIPTPLHSHLYDDVDLSPMPLLMYRFISRYVRSFLYYFHTLR
jgi:hypothetical protein